MAARLLLSILVATAAGSALAAPRDQANTPQSTVVGEPAATRNGGFTLYEHLADPMVRAIHNALATAGKDGDYLQKRDAAAVAEHYAEEGYESSWISGGKLTERAKKIIRFIGDSAADGLDPRDFNMPALTFGEAAKADTDAVAKADVMLSLAIVSYARQAYAGRLEPSKVSPNFGYEPHLPDGVAALNEAAHADDPAAKLAAYNPTHPEFIRLRDKLAEMRRAEVGKKMVEVPAGPTLKPGMSDPRVPALRARMELPAATEAADVYDPALVIAVEAFQKANRLKPDGFVGKGTLGVLNRVPVDPVPAILANMERWRWMPRDLGRFYVKVDIPGFQLDVVRGGTSIHNTRIVVGKVENQTPIFSDEIEHIIVNPAWNVPASITKKEMLPAAQSNPASLSGYEVFYNFNGRYRQIDPYSVDWYNVDIRRVQIRQPPGERNALGNIKFMFPNKYDVYLHDTPSKSLFQKDYRAFSHGCMRVMDPMAFADALLIEEPALNSAKLKKMIGGPERMVPLARHVPVHITYFTALVDENGKLTLRPDLYGHDKRIEAAFGLIAADKEKAVASN